jgi:hypothetical protein
VAHGDFIFPAIFSFLEIAGNAGTTLHTYQIGIGTQNAISFRSFIARISKKSLRYGYNKNSYRPILWKIVIQNSTGPGASFTLLLFFCKFKQVTMGAVRHGLCRRPWQSSARYSAMILLATSWATPGALG